MVPHTEDKPLKFDLISAGVPCQNHSTLNVHRQADDPKDALVLTALSFVEYIRPRFFVLENVRTWPTGAAECCVGNSPKSGPVDMLLATAWPSTR
jgi:hypothetical protein